MNKTSSIEYIESLFMPCAFEVIREQHDNEIEDFDALPFVWDLLWKASAIFDKAIENGRAQTEATTEAFEIFMYKSHES